MGHFVHCSATKTQAARRAIQNGQESLTALSKRDGNNQKSFAKWRKRTSVEDIPTGVKALSSSVPSIEEGAVIVVFRRHGLLPPSSRAGSTIVASQLPSSTGMRRCVTPPWLTPSLTGSSTTHTA